MTKGEDKPCPKCWEKAVTVGDAVNMAARDVVEAFKAVRVQGPYPDNEGALTRALKTLEKVLEDPPKPGERIVTTPTGMTVRIRPVANLEGSGMFCAICGRPMVEEQMNATVINVPALDKDKAEEIRDFFENHANKDPEFGKVKVLTTAGEPPKPQIWECSQCGATFDDGGFRTELCVPYEGDWFFKNGSWRHRPCGSWPAKVVDRYSPHLEPKEQDKIEDLELKTLKAREGGMKVHFDDGIQASVDRFIRDKGLDRLDEEPHLREAGERAAAILDEGEHCPKCGAELDIQEQKPGGLWWDVGCPNCEFYISGHGRGWTLHKFRKGISTFILKKRGGTDDEGEE